MSSNTNYFIITWTTLAYIKRGNILIKMYRNAIWWEKPDWLVNISSILYMLQDIPSCLGRRERWQRPVTWSRAHVASSKVESSSTILRAFWFCSYFTCKVTTQWETPPPPPPQTKSQTNYSFFFQTHLHLPPLSVPQGWCQQYVQGSPLSPDVQTLLSYFPPPLPAGWAALPPGRRGWEHGHWCEQLLDGNASGKAGLRLWTGWWEVSSDCYHRKGNVWCQTAHFWQWWIQYVVYKSPVLITRSIFNTFIT